MENIYGILSDSILSLKEKLRKVLSSNDEGELADFFSSADDLRKVHFKNKVSLCAIVNAKSGLCTEDCAFCAQSGKFKTKIKTYPLLTPQEILKSAEVASANGVNCFSIVTSGKGLNNDKELSSIAKSIELIAKKFPSLKRSASLGIINEKSLKILRDAGLQKYHHNLETSKAFFPNVSKTHSFEERSIVILTAKVLGFEICSGGIFGLGESWDDRIDLGLTLKRLKVDSIPINFLNPVKGTNLERREILNPKEALLIIALFRILLPDRDIKICGGRNAALGNEDHKIFSSGASGMMVGNYLTVSGNDFERDLKMIKNLGLLLLC